MEDYNKYYQSRHFLRLLHHYEKAVSQGLVPYMEADELTDIAEYYMTGKQDAKANQAIQAAIDMHPGSVDPQIFLARQKIFYGQLSEARAIIDEITEQEDSEVIYVRAELYIKEGQSDMASEFLLQQMKLMQDCMDTYLYDCTAIFMDYDQWEFANQWVKRLKDAYPNHPRIPIMEAEILMGLDNYENALPRLKAILDKEPYDSDAWNLLAETYIALEMYADAQEAADFALAINPKDSNALLMKGNAYMRSEQMADAIEYYKEYLEAQPDDFNVQLSLAICYSNEERYKEVVHQLEKTEQYIQKVPSRGSEVSQILQMKAYALSRLDRISEALCAIGKARETGEESLSWRYDMTEADIYLQAGNLKQAEAYFASALKNSPEQGDTLFNIALAYSNAGYNDCAIDLLDDVWTIFGTQEGKFVVPYLANCYLHKNDMPNYLKYLKLAPSCDREATQMLFRERFPGIAPENYYTYAYKDIYGVFPEIDEDQVNQS